VAFAHPLVSVRRSSESFALANNENFLTKLLRTRSLPSAYIMHSPKTKRACMCPQEHPPIDRNDVTPYRL